MDIVWLGHSCLRLRSLRTTLITDPYCDSVGLTLPRQKADIVTVSHKHPHHAYAEALDGHPRVLRGPGEYEIADFYITGMGTRRLDGVENTEGQVNTVFTMRAEGLTLCHLGDLNEMPSPKQVQELNQADLLFVPAGGVCTISAAKVAELVNLISPKIVVPLHYQTEEAQVGLESLDVFLGAMGVSEPAAGTKLSVSASSLPRELRVEVLRRTG